MLCLLTNEVYVMFQLWIICPSEKDSSHWWPHWHFYCWPHSWCQDHFQVGFSILKILKMGCRCTFCTKIHFFPWLKIFHIFPTIYCFSSRRGEGVDGKYFHYSLFYLFSPYYIFFSFFTPRTQWGRKNGKIISGLFHYHVPSLLRIPPSPPLVGDFMQKIHSCGFHGEKVKD